MAYDLSAIQNALMRSATTKTDSDQAKNLVALGIDPSVASSLAKSLSSGASESSINNAFSKYGLDAITSAQAPVATQVEQPSYNLAQVMSAIRGSGGTGDTQQASALESLGIGSDTANSIAKSIGNTLNMNSISSVLNKYGVDTTSSPTWASADGSNLNSLSAANAVNPYYMSKQGASIYDYLGSSDTGNGYFLPSSIYQSYNNGNGDIYGTKQSINADALKAAGGGGYTQNGQSGYYFPTLDAFKSTLSGSGYDDKGTLNYYRTGEQQSNDNPFGGGLLGSIGNLVSGIGKATGLSQPLVDANLAGSNSIVPVAAQIAAAVTGNPELSAAISAGRSVSDGAPIDQALLNAGASYGIGQYVVPEIKGMLTPNLAADMGGGPLGDLNITPSMADQITASNAAMQAVPNYMDVAGQLQNPYEYNYQPTGEFVGPPDSLNDFVGPPSSLNDFVGPDSSLNDFVGPDASLNDFVGTDASLANGSSTSINPLTAVRGISIANTLFGNKTATTPLLRQTGASRPNYTGVDYSQIMGLLNAKAPTRRGLLG